MAEIKKLEPRKLVPPPEAVKRIIEIDKNKLPKNKILRLIVLFFGEGL